MAGHLERPGPTPNARSSWRSELGNQSLLTGALNGKAWALQRDDPEGALAAAEQFLEVQRASGVARNTVPGLLALAAGLRARLGDDHGALPVLHDAVVIARDDGTLPQAAAALAFALNPLCRTGQQEVAATLIGALERGALAQVAGFPGTADSRARTLARIRDTLGVEKTDQLVAQGAALTRDELFAYALAGLGTADR